MLAIIIKLLMTFAPFVKEILFGKSELAISARRNKYFTMTVVSMVLSICIYTYGLRTVTNLNDRLNVKKGEIAILQERIDRGESIIKMHEIQYKELQERIILIEGIVSDYKKENNKLDQELKIYKNRLNDCNKRVCAKPIKPSKNTFENTQEGILTKDINHLLQ